MRATVSRIETGSAALPLGLTWPLRLFTGLTFVYAGLQHLTDPSYFDPTKAGYIGHLVAQYAVASPIHDFLVGFVAPNAVLFGWIVAISEVVVGIATLGGFLFRLAALAGLMLNFTFFLSATWNAFPFYFGSDIVFVMCWLTLLLTGPQPKSSVDGFLATRYPSLGWLVVKTTPSNTMNAELAPAKANTVQRQAQLLISGKAKLYPKQVREINRAFDQIKRQFVLHRETQTTLEFMRALVISLGVDRNDAVRILGMLQNILNRQPTEGASTRVRSSIPQ
ncbi:MAG TPA: TQO small subunit DoxD [Candidatus Dormibacteraeota bacterium]|nr:TQO small subunit DoxD [Candidatus Dormibacteraeota bacterium]